MSLRVAYLIDSLGGGGSERSLAEILPHLMRAGVEPRVFVLADPGAGFGDMLRGHGIPLESIPAGSWWRRIRALRRRLREWPPALLHTTLFYSDLLGRLAAVGTGIPVLTSLVSSRYERRRLDDPAIRRWRMGLVRRVDGWTGRHLTERFHAVSAAAKTSAVRWLRFEPERITVIQRGRDTERLGEPSVERRRQARRTWGIADPERLVVNVGRHVFQKGQAVLVEAMAQLISEGRPARLIVAGGEGPCTAELRALIRRHGLDERVELAGFVEDVPGLLAAADVFAFPSRLEGFPGAVLEAMAMGLPVVASDIAPLREIFADGGGGLLVEEGSPTAMAAALAGLFDDPASSDSLSAAGRAAFLDRYDIRATVPATLELYREVAACG